MRLINVFQADLLQGPYSHSTPSPGSRGNEPLSRPRQADWAASIKRNMMRQIVGQQGARICKYWLSWEFL